MIPHLLGGEVEECECKTFRENVVPFPKTPGLPINWTLFTRPFEFTREVLIMPSPDAIDAGVLPHSNVDMVESAPFWMAAQNYALLLKSQTPEAQFPVTRVVVNFGAWETALRAKPFLRECHAHAHLWITPDFVRHFKPLRGHDYQPEDYLLTNARQLERERLFYDRMASIENLELLVQKIADKVGVV